jgi:hypothetical protein
MRGVFFAKNTNQEPRNGAFGESDIEGKAAMGSGE